VKGIDISTDTEQCLAYESEGIAVITLNRPQARNALTKEMLAGLERALDHAERSASVRVVVVTGAGGAFCAGGDVKSMAAASGSEGPSLDERIHLQRLSQRNTAGRMYLMPKPVIAMLPGAAAGAGLSIALAADLRTMADTAFITTAFARVGFSGDYGGTFFLTHLIGAARARELYFLSERVGAQECKALGIANQVFPADQLEQQTMALARKLAAGPPIAYRYMKENLNRAAMGGNVIDCLDLEASHHVHAGLSEDHRNAAQAFVDKREPVFKGR
jgi:2-(1,2-epoxy-1,2-dihydrophenyl)acetyl-CoA isomerase